ncbi:MAG: Mov34/MPN/PAD-1 family protein [Wenzhouxiangella sp.]|nr:Mov34/MPN/PAD-1 family protein [Wenzhouxiangella sp.]MCH8479655.1 Mov34/MPN/PAD-1 family protein [Wenzhouxiangella sp.]
MSFHCLIGDSGQQLVLDASVLSHFKNWQQLRQGMPEAGGQLFGTISETCVTVKKATGPRPSDRRGPFYFVADRLAERREIRAMHKSGLHYFGDWHTHPQAVPTPSATDLESMSDLFVRSKHQLNAFLMIIVGTEQFPDGLHISLHEANVWTKLEIQF